MVSIWLSRQVFFLVFFIIYWAIPSSRLKWQNVVLWLASYIFYGWWDWRFLLLLFFTSGVDFLAAKKIHAEKNQFIARRWLILSVCVNLLTLGFFKYYNFFLLLLAIEMHMLVLVMRDTWYLHAYKNSEGNSVRMEYVYGVVLTFTMRIELKW